MHRIIAIAAALMIATAATPALAKHKKHHRAHHPVSDQSYVGWNGNWETRNVSDPSFGNRAGIGHARSTGRCVEDLGYGRYEYCGW